MEAISTSSSQPGSTPLGDPVAEARRVVDAARAGNVVARLLGGTAVHLQSPDGRPLLPRDVKDIDLVTRRGARTTVSDVLSAAGYVPDQMFNALHGGSRLLFYDETNARKLDVFVGSFSMCHQVPIAERLEREPLTVPLAELVLTKLQIVELTERDQRDMYNLFFHHDVSNGTGGGIEADYIARVLAADWGFWRTSKATVERCIANIGEYGLPAGTAATITGRLDALWQRVDAEPKTTRWKLRGRVGERVRWYDEPEEHTAQG